MSPRLCKRARCVVALGLLWVPSQVAGQPGELRTGPKWLDYAAPAGCPTPAEFSQAVLRRTQRPPAAGSSTAGLTLTVRLELGRDPVGASGTLQVTDAGRRLSERAIEGASCDEVAEGLALVAAIVLDAGRPSAVPEDASAGADRRRSPTQSGGDVRAARMDPDSTPPLETALTLSLAGFVASGVMPSARPGLQGTVVFELDGARWPPVVLLGAGRFSAGQEIQSTDGVAQFRWWTGMLALCSGLRRKHLRTALWFCAAGELGVLSATGSHTERPERARRSWTALGPAAVVTWAFHHNWGIHGGLEGLFPLSRDRFLLGEQSVHAVPVFGGRGHVGLGFRL